MMLHLIFNVGSNSISLRNANRECSKAILPSEFVVVARGIIDVLACVGFHSADEG